MFLVGRWGALPHSIIQGPSGWGICHLPHMASQVSLHVDIYQGKRLGGKVTHISDSPEQSSDIHHWGKPVTCPDVDERRRGVGTVIPGGAATSQQLLLTKERGQEALQNSLCALPQSMAWWRVQRTWNVTIKKSLILQSKPLKQCLMLKDKACILHQQWTFKLRNTVFRLLLKYKVMSWQLTVEFHQCRHLPQLNLTWFLIWII